MGTYYGGDSFELDMQQGVMWAGGRFALGYCPTCQLLNESEVEKRFAVLRDGQLPGSRVNRMYLWSFYGVGEQPPAGWEYYWDRMAAWLKGE